VEVRVPFPETPARGALPVAPAALLPPPDEGVYPRHHAPQDRGEEKVWRMLGRQRPAGWTIWHHLVVGRAADQAEIDFAIAVPGRGVVLVEVKAGQMARRDGVWHQNGAPLERAPGAQVERARRSLLGTLKRTFPRVYLPEVAVALCFPETSGASFVAAGGPPILFREDVEWFEVGGAERLLRAFSGREYPPDNRFLGALHSLWGPDWVPLAALTRAPGHAEVAWRQLTPAQLTVLTCLDDSPRLLVEGPPGSGKTVLLMALAARLQGEGVPTLVLTFTRAIAAELRRAGLASVHPIREWALSEARAAGIVPAGADGLGWAAADWAAMLGAVTAALRAAPPEGRWEVVLVDEHQDLGPEDWALLDALVAGDARLWLFGDDAQRALWHAQGVSVPARLRPGGIFRLRAGLRCPIALLDHASALLHGRPAAEDPGAREALDACLHPVPLPAGADDAARASMLEQVLDLLLADDRLSTSDIAVLSFGSLRTSRLQAPGALGRHPRCAADEDPVEGQVLADTVLRAKGLERPVVVLTDLDRAHPAALPRLLYVGLTRASWRCVVVGTPAELAALC
jgi:hypothetical protein